jgi:uncharacterized phage infection (PIP) family protein YhgE
MKEGYIQMKISEFNDKINQLEQLLSMEDQKLRLVQEKVGEYKEVIKKLQDFQDFKNQAVAQIRKENETLMKQQVEQISKQLSEVLKELTMNKADKINETVQMLQKREEEIARQAEVLEEHAKKLVFLLEHNDILMMKLANRRILTEHDVIEMQRRATKKAETTE